MIENIQGNKEIELLDPKIDFAFKRLFADESKEAEFALINLLNAIIETKDEKKITKIIYKNPYTLTEHKEQKESIMDIKVETQSGEKIDIEMQINDVDSFRQRALKLWSSMYNSQLEKGEPYQELKKCIFISILDFNLMKETEEWHNVYKVLEVKKHFELLEDMEMHFIELRKIEKPKEDYILKNNLEKWVLFLKYGNNKEMKNLIEKLRKEEGINMAAQVLKKISQDEKARMLYEERLTAIRDENSRISRARKEGKLEEKLEAARNMLLLNVDIAIIEKTTGLTKEEIEKLK